MVCEEAAEGSLMRLPHGFPLRIASLALLFGGCLLATFYGTPWEEGELGQAWVFQVALVIGLATAGVCLTFCGPSPISAVKGTSRPAAATTAPAAPAAPAAESVGSNATTSTRAAATAGSPAPPAASAAPRSGAAAGCAGDCAGSRPGAAVSSAAPAPAPVPAPPLPSPRSATRKLVGDRLGAAQADRAAEKILALAPFVSGRRRPSLDEIWGFFDMSVPPYSPHGVQDSVVQQLRGKLNRQRLLMHPDKNAHPEAERTFKFLEQCHERLVGAVSRRGSRVAESAHQRAQREEQELESERRQRAQQERERRLREEQLAREEDEREARRQAEEEDRRRRETEAKARLDRWLLDKEARSAAAEKRSISRVSQPPQLSGLFGATCGNHGALLDERAEELADRRNSLRPVGYLQLQITAAKDLPSLGLLASVANGGVFAEALVGNQRWSTAALPGCNPRWNAAWKFEVREADTALQLSVFREAVGWGLLKDALPAERVGRVEIPFLDLEEWAGCPIGRVLEPEDSDPAAAGQCMVIELQASFEWW